MSTAAYLSRDQVRAIDRRAIDEFGVPGVVLMENAGRGTAERLVALGIRGPVVLCCGKGNNGGDGFVIARHLDNLGHEVHVWLFAEPQELTGDAAINYRIIEKSKLPITVFAGDLEQLRQELSRADWIVDALFGTGLSGPVRPPFDQVIAAINASGKRVLAVDIPSGLDCDTGQPLGASVRAEQTMTFVALKQGFAAPAAKEWTGELQVVDIGAPRSAWEREIR